MLETVFRTLEIMSAKISKWFNPGIRMPDVATVFPTKYYRFAILYNYFYTFINF